MTRGVKSILGPRRLLLLAPLVALACQHGNFDVFEETQRSHDARHLYEPLVANAGPLLERMRATETEAVVFHLTQGGAARMEEPPSEDAYWQADKAVFFRTGGSAQPQWLYFDARRLRVWALDEAPPKDTDLVKREGGGFSLFRSVLVTKGGVARTGNLDVFRFDFHLGETGAIESGGHMRLTSDPGADVQATPIAETDQVVFLRQETDDRRRLMATSFAGGAPWPLIPDQAYDVLHPRLLDDDRLAFFSNEPGYFTLFEVADVPERIRERTEGASSGSRPTIEAVPFEYPLPADRSQGRWMLGSASEEGRLRPVVFELPETLDLTMVCEWVRLHNPAVNEQRARYAAALIEVGRFRLANWPRLDVGLSYETFVEVFEDLPMLFSGDTLSREIVTGLIGLSQPLLDFGENRARTQNALWQAEVSRHLLDDEINSRTAEAAEVFFELVYLQKRIALQEQQLAVTQRREAYYRTLRSKGESTRLELKAVAQVDEGLRSELAFQRDRVGLLSNRLNALMGLPHDTELALNDAGFRFEAHALPSLQEATQIAELNHPRIEAARSALRGAFYQRAGGPSIRPRAGLGAAYDIESRDFNRVETQVAPGGGLQNVTVSDRREDETFTLDLLAQIPLASRKAKKLHRELWDRSIDALQLVQERQTRVAKLGVEQAYVDFHASQRDFGAKKMTLAYFQERLRVVRLHNEYGIPGTTFTVVRPLGDPGPVEETFRTSALAPMTAEFELLSALDRVFRTERDLGARFARVWREMGQAGMLSEKSEAARGSVRGREQVSLWMWRTREAIESDEALETMTRILEGQDVGRVYAYLYSDATLLDTRRGQERVALLVDECAGIGAEVWALLGEPDWLADGGAEALETATDRIAAFNARRSPFEPKIAGVKLDIEPHSQPGWDGGGETRAALRDRYVDLVITAQEALDGALPLWVDVSPKLLNEGGAALDVALSAADGATLMAYSSSGDRVTEWSNAAMTRFEALDKPLEIGVELSRQAAEGDSVRDWPRDRLRAFREQLSAELGARPGFSGFAYHDYQGLIAYMGED